MELQGTTIPMALVRGVLEHIGSRSGSGSPLRWRFGGECSVREPGGRLHWGEAVFWCLWPQGALQPFTCGGSWIEARSLGLGCLLGTGIGCRVHLPACRHMSLDIPWGSVLPGEGLSQWLSAAHFCRMGNEHPHPEEMWPHAHRILTHGPGGNWSSDHGMVIVTSETMATSLSMAQGTVISFQKWPNPVLSSWKPKKKLKFQGT